MYLPQNVTTCMAALNAAGYRVYAVGGCVRDALLGLTPQDYDLCTDAAPADIRRVFAGYRQVTAGEKHGTVGIVVDGDVIEITFGERTLRVRVKNVKDFVTKADASTLYEVID